MKNLTSLISSIVFGSVLIGSTFLQKVEGETREVLVYSGRHYNTDRMVFKEFAEETGIRVRLIEATGISLIERLKREGKNSNADVVLLVDAARITNAAKLGLLQSYKSEFLEKNVPNNYKDPEGRWYALTRRVRVLVVNPKKVDLNTVKTYSDLADPSLKGLVCLRRRDSPYNQSLVADQLALNGEEATRVWLENMISNVSQPYFPGDIGLTRAVAQGKCGVGIVNHYYVARMLAGVNGRRDTRFAKKVKVVTPDPAHVNVSAGGLAKYAKNKTEAIKLLEFLASPTGSKGLAEPTYEHPLIGFNKSEELKGFGTFNPDKVTISQLGQFNSKAINMMTEAGWE